jgi:hypothetical protein
MSFASAFIRQRDMWRGWLVSYFYMYSSPADFRRQPFLVLREKRCLVPRANKKPTMRCAPCGEGAQPQCRIVESPLKSSGLSLNTRFRTLGETVIGDIKGQKAWKKKSERVPTAWLRPRPRRGNILAAFYCPAHPDPGYWPFGVDTRVPAFLWCSEHCRSSLRQVQAHCIQMVRLYRQWSF